MIAKGETVKVRDRKTRQQVYRELDDELTVDAAKLDRDGRRPGSDPHDRPDLQGQGDPPRCSPVARRCQRRCSSARTTTMPRTC